MTNSIPNALAYQKHGLNLHKNQVDLVKNRVELMGKEPGAFDAEIGLLNDFQESNQTRKPGWRALLDGMASGLKCTLKSAEGEKKRATYANMEKMLGSFEEVGRQLQQQNEKNRLRQEDMEMKVIPSAVGYLTYLQNNPSYDEAFNNLNSRVEQLKTVMPFDGELVALSPRNYEVGIFKDRKTGQLKETPISSLLPPDLLKGRPDLNTYERAKDAEKMSLERQKADAKTLKAQTRLGQNAGQYSDAQKQARLAQTSLVADEEETRTYLELYGLLKNPDIDPTSSLGTGIKNWVSQNVPLVGELAGEGLAKQQAYSQATANLKGQAFKKHGYRNQAEFENIHTLPDTLPRKEALKFVEAELRKKGIPIPEQASLEQTRLGQAGLGQAGLGETEAGGNVAGQIKVQDPSTGQIGLLSPEQAKIAISRGGVKVE